MLRSGRERDARGVARNRLADAHRTEPHALRIDGLTVAQVGDLAARLDVPLRLLAPSTGSLEDGYVRLVADHLDYAATAGQEALR